MVIALLASSGIGTGIAVHTWTTTKVHASPPLIRVKTVPPPVVYGKPGPVTTYNVNDTLSTPTGYPPVNTGSPSAPSTGSTGGTGPVTGF